jgi:hypothetical protein
MNAAASVAPIQYTFALDATATLFPRPTGSTTTRATNRR